MGNCLVTKLAETVNDSNLRKLGEMRIQVSRVDNPTYGPGGTQRFVIYPTEAITLTCIGGTFADGTGTSTGTTQPLTAVQSTLIASNGDFQISIPKKTAIRSLTLSTAAFGINVEETYGSHIEGLVITDSNSYGDIKYLSRSIINFYGNNTNVTGDIKYLGNCTLLSVMSISDTEIGGSLEDLAQAQVANGRTSGSISCLVLRSGVTYQGVLCTSNHTITFNSSVSGGYTIS